ncbi:mechanosensitive ion channel family protein [Novipirellula herctigrandis]|uniref:mechanosensitive ion channel family protein n=1 Tax=Novipirellula herctigrandis TaxID=2527986 RepID=UPI003AF3B68D
MEACNELHDLIQERQCVDRNSRPHREVAWRVLDCIDSSEIPAFARDQRTGEVAAALKEILDRVELPPWEQIPDAAEIQAAGGYEEFSRWRIPDTRITIERVEEGPQKHEYLFSSGTVQRAIGYFQEIDHRPYRTDGPPTSPDFYKWYLSAPGSPLLGSLVQRLPEWMRFGRTLGLTNWKWPGVILLLIIAVSVMWVLYSLQISVTNRVSPQKRLQYFPTLIFPLAAVAVPPVFLAICERYLTIRSTPLYVISFASYVVTIVAAIVALFAASTRVAESIIASPKINTYGLNAQLIRISSKLVAILLSVVLLVTGGQYLGIPIATLLASAGIGGIALALGAQDTLKNLFATIALMADKPCRVGDRIRFEGYDGFVEDIGLRSTKLRLLDGHVVTIPNEQIAGQHVENISQREHIRRSAEIRIPLDTPREQVERAIAIIREKLDQHEGMDNEFPPRVFFDEFGDDAFRIRFIYWYSPAHFWDFKAFGEKLNLEIFAAYEAEGIQFSLPLRHSYWKQDARQGPLEIQLTERSTGDLITN